MLKRVGEGWRDREDLSLITNKEAQGALVEYIAKTAYLRPAVKRPALDIDDTCAVVLES